MSDDGEFRRGFQAGAHSVLNELYNAIRFLYYVLKGMKKYPDGIIRVSR